MNILVVDTGTSGMKGMLINEKGEQLFAAGRSYQPEFSGEGCVEQEAAVWSNALLEIASEVARFGDIHAIAITAQRSSVIPMDADGRPLRKALLWQDVRNEKLCAVLSARNRDIFLRCGSAVNTVYSGGKMAWLRENEPEVWRRTKKLVTVPDYLVYQMTGEYHTDATYGSRSLLMDLRHRCWDDGLLSIFGVEEDMLCPLSEPGSVVGYVNAAFGAASGIRPGIPVISAGGDQQCAALGLGVIASGDVSINLGTGAYLTETLDALPAELCSDVVYGVSAIAGQYIRERSVLTCGCAIDWLLDVLYGKRDYALVDQALQKSRPGAGGVFCLPFFQGRSAPVWDSGATGFFGGLTLSSTREDILRALLEGICHELAEHLLAMEKDLPVKGIRISGGLTRSKCFCKLLADILGRPIIAGEQENATAIGAWINAAVTLGIYGSAMDAWQTIGTEKENVYRPDVAQPHTEHRKRTQQIQAAIADLEVKEE